MKDFEVGFCGIKNLPTAIIYRLSYAVSYLYVITYREGHMSSIIIFNKVFYIIHSSRNAYKVFLLSDQLRKFFVSVECQQLHEVPAVQSLATKHPYLFDVLGASQDIAMIGQGYITIVLLYLVLLFVQIERY